MLLATAGSRSSAPTGFAIGEYPIIAVGRHAARVRVSASSPGGFEFVSIELPPSSIDLLDQSAINAERTTLAQVYAGSRRSAEGPAPDLARAGSNDERLRADVDQ
jgi:hypothetical protein